MTLTTEQKIERVAAAISKCDPWTNGEAARAAIAEMEKIRAEEAAVQRSEEDANQTEFMQAEFMEDFQRWKANQLRHIGDHR